MLYMNNGYNCKKGFWYVRWLYFHFSLCKLFLKLFQCQLQKQYIVFSKKREPIAYKYYFLWRRISKKMTSSKKLLKNWKKIIYGVPKKRTVAVRKSNFLILKMYYRNHEFENINKLFIHTIPNKMIVAAQKSGFLILRIYSRNHVVCKKLVLPCSVQKINLLQLLRKRKLSFSS